MIKYDSYKESDIEWLGEVPEHWKNYRIDSTASLVRGNTGLLKDELLANGEYVALQYGKTYKVDEVNNTFDFFVNSEYYKKGQIVNLGDTVLISTSETIEDLGHSCFYNRRDLGLLGGEQILLKPIKKIVSEKYLYYYSKFFKYELQKYATGLKVFRFNIDDLKEISIAIPSKEEQTTIAKYLDNKTQAIDKKVNLLDKKIGYYKELRKSIINETVTKGLDKTAKLKDSGIKWIGQIPEHWEVKRLKDSFDIFTGNSISDKTGYENPIDAIPYVATKDINFDTGQVDFNNGVYISKSDNSFKKTKGYTSLICIEGANAGKKIGFTETPVSFVNKLCAIKVKSYISDDKYNFYYLNSVGFSEQFFTLISGLIGGVSINKVKEFLVLLPPKAEQTKIATYLDHKTQTIDKTVGNIQKQITTLKELRKTLINDVVTGKIKVVE